MNKDIDGIPQKYNVMQAKGLIICICLIVVVGGYYVTSVLLTSLSPNAKSLHARAHIDVSRLKQGGTAEYINYSQHIIVRKDSKNNPPYTVLALPMRDKQYLLPEFDWSRSFLPCTSFIQEKVFQCLDKYDGEYLWYHYMKWNKAGVYIGENRWGNHVPDLPHARYQKQGKFIVLLVD